MVYEIEFWKKSPHRECHPFVKNIKTRKEARVELSDLVPIGSPVRYKRSNRYAISIEVIVQGIPEDANAFYRICSFPYDDPGNDDIIQYYHVSERFHEVSNLP